MAATFSHLPAFLSLFSQKLFVSDPHQQSKFRWTAQQQHRLPPHFTLRASSAKKKTRKVKSNAELCNELLEFLTAAGLPERHVPSLKELSQNGRKDLANIVRRRGYKLIKELLAGPTKTDVNGIADNGVAGIQDSINDSEELITGEDRKVNNLDEDLSLSSEALALENDSASFISHPHSNHDGSGRSTVESSADSYNVEDHSEEVDNVDGNDFVVTGVPVTENQSCSSEIDPDFNSENQSNMPLEISTSSSLDVLDDFSLPTTVQVKENKSFNSSGWDLNSDGRLSVPLESVTGFSSDRKVLDRGQDGKVDNSSAEDTSSTEVAVTEDHSRGQEGKVDNFSEEDSSSTEDAVMEDHSRGQDGKVENLSEEDSSSTEVAVLEDHSTGQDGKIDSLSDHDSYTPLESLVNSSLEEKVANFMQNGDLDTVEDNDYGVLIENDTKETKGESEFGTTEEVQLRIPTPEHSKNALDGSDATMALSPRTSACKQLLPSTTVDPSLKDDSSSDEGSISVSDTGFNVQTSEMEDEFDISRLKSMLVHQKEMELLELKEQFEREKYDLSMLQTMVETEISRSQKLISEKDAELLAVEQSLSGLVEVEIQYCGDGEVVEVSGSFNGWHHRIQLDPQPSPTGLRLWSTTVWLYPGTYEIKFIVDGQWKIDPEREYVTTGTICNNVLQVDG